MLSSGGTVVAIPPYRRKPVTGLSAFAFRFGSLSSLVRAPACTPVWPTSRSAVPDSRRLSRSSAFVVTVRLIASGRALRIGSVAGSQFGLRTHAALLPGAIDLNMYGPDAAGLA